MPIAVNDQTGETMFLGDDGNWQKAKTAVNPQTKEMLAYDGKAWQPVPQQSKGVLGYVDDAVRSLASGMTFGWADELSAKTNELVGNGTYEENLAAEQRRDQQIPTAIKVPGEIGGAVAGTLATLPASGAAAAATGLSKLPTVARMALGGAAGGAAYGAGEANPGERLKGAGSGALIGGVVGAALPHTMRAAGGVVNAVRGAISPRANVAADLGRAIMRDADTPAALMSRTQELQAARPGVAALADAGGENVRGLVERVAQTPGAGRTIVVPALTGRQQGQMARLSTDLRQLTGTSKTAHQAIQDTMAERAKAARPLYDEAFNFNARTAPEIEQAWNRITSTGWGQHVLRSPDFRKTLQTEYGIADVRNAPLMVQIDAWKKQVDGIVGEAVRKGNANQSRVLSAMRDDLIGVVDQHNPAYAAARNAWAGPSRYLDAVEEGRKIFDTKIGAEELRSALQHMPEAEREAFRIGAVSSMLGKMGNDTAKMGDMTKYFRSPEMRAKVAAIMPDEAAAAKWADRLNFEVSSSELTSRALGNSATARRLAERQDADGIAGDLIMDAFAGTPPVSLLRRAIGTVPKKIRDTLRSRSDEVLGELLTNPDSMKELTRAIEAVGRRQASVAARPARDAAAIGGANSYMLNDQR